MDVYECIFARRDTRHFTDELVPDEVIERALRAAHGAPSVGLSEPWRFVIVKSQQVKDDIYNLFCASRSQAEGQIHDAERLALHHSLKLEAIRETPLGIAVFCAPPPATEYTIGVVGTRETLAWSCACAIQNMWLALTAEGFGAGWVSILNYPEAKKVFDVPAAWELLGYFCVGRPATDYDGKPMLESHGWKQRSAGPQILIR